MADLGCCPRLIECLPQLIHDDPPHQEDVKKVDWTEPQLGDDPYDCVRYGLYSRFAPTQKTTEATIRDRADTIKDPLARWSYLQVDLPKSDENAPFRQNFKMWWEQ